MSHHFDDNNIKVEPSESKTPSWNVSFPSSVTGEKITMRIPKMGVFDDAGSKHELTKAEVLKLAKKIARILRKELAK